MQRVLTLVRSQNSKQRVGTTSGKSQVVGMAPTNTMPILPMIEPLQPPLPSLPEGLTAPLLVRYGVETARWYRSVVDPAHGTVCAAAVLPDQGMPNSQRCHFIRKSEMQETMRRDKKPYQRDSALHVILAPLNLMLSCL